MIFLAGRDKTSQATARLDLSCPGQSGHGSPTTWLDTAWRDAAGQGESRRGAVWRGLAGSGKAPLYMTRRVRFGPGQARRGSAGLGEAPLLTSGRGMVRQDGTRRGVALAWRVLAGRVSGFPRLGEAPLLLNPARLGAARPRSAWQHTARQVEARQGQAPL